MRTAPTMFAAAAISAPFGAVAQQAPDLAKYDCVTTDGGPALPGDRLLADGFRIVSVGRFGSSPNVMLADTKSDRRANCFVRQEPGQEGRN